MEQRKKNLCVYVGKSSSSTLGLKFTKLHWCCFGNMLNKVVQVEGRKQLGIDFGSGSSPDCRGLTFTEIVKLDFDNMDFSEFEADIVKKMKMPVVNDVQTRIQGSIHSVQEPKDERTLTGNGMDGVNSKISTDK